jgi:dUTPase
MCSGFDLSSAYDIVVPKHGKAIVKTDLSISIPENTYARVVKHNCIVFFGCCNKSYAFRHDV